MKNDHKVRRGAPLTDGARRIWPQEQTTTVADQSLITPGTPLAPANFQGDLAEWMNLPDPDPADIPRPPRCRTRQVAASCVSA